MVDGWVPAKDAIETFASEPSLSTQGCHGAKIVEIESGWHAIEYIVFRAPIGCKSRIKTKKRGNARICNDAPVRNLDQKQFATDKSGASGPAEKARKMSRGSDLDGMGVWQGGKVKRRQTKGVAISWRWRNEAVKREGI